MAPMYWKRAGRGFEVVVDAKCPSEDGSHAQGTDNKPLQTDESAAEAVSGIAANPGLRPGSGSCRLAPAAVLSPKPSSADSPLSGNSLCGIPVAPSMNPAIDSNALTYLVEAMTPGYAPILDESSLAAERLAMIRTYLYTDVLF